ncbi:28S ribosomal protein S5, mitochondrial-like [Dendronephthya gigantea]|uniref:28S ribosomal protein S5, mitochondrial-like n=1 Tax=Dendronephthya gigantea TaxID=151771 RepID=UPI00106C1666|nr:28S ribosomal protein S5, mitochondrial-like [Dendronephthya gigantea]
MALRGLLSKYLFGCPFKNINFALKTGTVVNVNSFHEFSANIFKYRQLSSVTGDYEKLWDAVTGGRGTGRGKKKTKPKDKESTPTGFGKFGKKWPGLDTPVRVKPGKGGKKLKEGYLPKPQMSEVTRPKKGFPVSKSFVSEREPRREMPAWKKAFIAGEKMYGQDLSRRGWSGKTWRGREFGPPETATGDSLEDFQSIVLELRRVSNMTSGGRKRSQRAIVVVGNKNGAAGFAVGKAQSGISALKKAKNKAAKYLYYVDRCEDRTIYHDFLSTHRKTKIKFERKPPGYGLRCHRIIRAVADCIGIEDMRCKITGSTTPISVVRAVFQGLLSQETHEQLAERKGLHVVECRPENSMRPMVVASPSPQAARAAEKQRTLEDKDYDFDEIFDPYKGAHRPRKVKL